MFRSQNIQKGDKINTKWGVVEAVSEGRWIQGSGRKKVWVIDLLTERGRTYRVGRRKLNSIVKGDGKVPQDDDQEDYSEEDRDHELAEADVPSSDSPEAKDDLATMIAEAIGPHVKGALDEDKVKEIIDGRLTQLSVPRSVVVKQADSDISRDMGVQHYVFESLLKLCANKLNTWLVGPAGSGKSTIAAAVAEALELKFYTCSVCLTTSESKLMGYNNVSDGAYVRTPLRDAYEFGGVFLLDEVDLGNPGILAVLNQLMAGTFCGFPDGVVKKHEDFILIAGANTVGKGADRTYNARLQIDGATLDRFIFMQFDYDPAIEASMCGVPAHLFDYHEQKPVEFVDVEDDHLVQRRCELFCKRVNALRRSVDELKVRHIISPRATSAGCTMLRAGFPLDATMDMAVWKGLDKDTANKAASNADLEAIS